MVMDGDMYINDREDFEKNIVGKDFYLDIVYTVFEEDNDNKNYDDYMRENKTVDKVGVYLNGELYGYGYYGHKGYEIGLSTWNNDNYDFYIGIAKKNSNMNLYYLKGNCYSTRLYQRGLNKDEIKLNYDKTVKYRNSFKNDSTS